MLFRSSVLRTLQTTLKSQRFKSTGVTRGVAQIPQYFEQITALPPLPPFPQTNPTPWLEREELEMLYSLPYLTPWTFRPRLLPSNAQTGIQANFIHVSSDVNYDKTLGNGLVLTATYKFRTQPAAAHFMDEVQRISEEEQHDPLFLRLYLRNNNPKVDVHYAVLIRSITREAFIPQSILDMRPRHLTAKRRIYFPETLIIPGLTKRDIRFVLLVDKMFRDIFFPNSSTSDDLSESGIQSSVRHPITAEDRINLVQSVFRRGFCPCCGSNHELQQCPERNDHPPQDRKGCYRCGKTGHWDVDCSL
ncbi:hypothetical protein BDP27DRAFT_1320121 [Rhodocollybia butyracea]|uniref:CCHC-type domain-containing protein n=1 Tax=Rhodocollybia butyracea TaxID=206335 RepID=A0A9P5Q0H5_9AGAR|nr:hypothetical protein BDP27DRAFT_1320121 [Rhodocollybia butyracea]